MARGRLSQLAFYLAAFATTAIVLAIVLNWRNDRLGFWLNAVIIGVGDVPFILFILVPAICRGGLGSWGRVSGLSHWLLPQLPGLARQNRVRGLWDSRVNRIQRVPPPPPAGRGNAARGRGLGRRSGAEFQHHRARRTVGYRFGGIDEWLRPQLDAAWCQENCGVVLGHGIGELSGKASRIAHMGHVNAPMIFGTLSVIEMALGATGIPHGSGGVQAAITWLARQVRDT